MTISQTPGHVHQRGCLPWQRLGHARACHAPAALRSRWVLIALGLWLAAGGLAFAQGGPAPPPPVTVAKPVVKDIIEQTDFIGRFEAVDQVDIRARVSGYLDKVHFKDGSLVRAGNLLFTIDPRPYRNSLEQAKAAVTSSQVRLEFAQSDLARAEQLRMTGNIPDQIFDQRRQAFLTGKADLDRAQAALRQAELDVGFTEIKAPLTGRISRKLVSEGNLVNANETVLTNIVSLHPIQFYFDVDERSYLAFSRQTQGGTRTSANGSANEALLTLTDERLGQRKGQLDFVDNRLDEASGTIRVRAVFDNKDMLLTPGLFGRVTIGASDPYKGILLPDEAIGSDQDRRVVYAVDEKNVVHLKPVRIGPRIDGYRVIRDGLTGNETVVVNGLVRVRH
ncbi:efflux RND transporter periplasmic adaptor subunit [Microvirga aerophila]|uniref:efflux RND transporter periplasmic adaptor subunit n=1 Tax=Microvirga aerophila TaxID=670291 RepID=UPI000DEEF240|nr:efflux RND transporter periplasmic adaptor subunit [Microvirga aerophila]